MTWLISNTISAAKSDTPQLASTHVRDSEGEERHDRCNKDHITHHTLHEETGRQKNQPDGF